MTSNTTTSTTSNSSSSTPWVEKYRPKTLKEVSHQNEVVSTLQNAVETNRLPHLLLYGPPGTGKTSVALALCKTLWHPSQWNRRVLELNASDERGISVVRDKIKHFASLAVGTGDGVDSTAAAQAKKYFVSNKVTTVSTATGTTASEDTDPEAPTYPNPPFKIIILDEADTVTPDAQAALRRVIEAHSKVTRFILICNYVTRIIEPLASRCAKFRFQSLPPSSMIQRLTTISEAERCRFHNNDRTTILNEILDLSQGDMRRAVTTLQSLHTLAGKDGEIVLDNISEMAGLPPSHVIDGLMDIFLDLTSNYDRMDRAVNDIILEGYAAQQVMKALLKKILVLDSTTTLNEMNKAKIAIKIAEADKNLIDSADESLQLMAVCSLMMQCFKEPQQ